MKLKINKANQENANDIYLLDRQLFKHDNFSLESVKEELANLNRVYLIAVNDVNKVVGFLGVNVVFDYSEIIKIAVDFNYQRLGVANKMLKEMIGLLREKSVFKVMLEVEEGNEKAIKFYEKTGFKLVNIRKNYYENGASALIYELEIN